MGHGYFKLCFGRHDGSAYRHPYRRATVSLTTAKINWLFILYVSVTNNRHFPLGQIFKTPVIVFHPRTNRTLFPNPRNYSYAKSVLKTNFFFFLDNF